MISARFLSDNFKGRSQAEAPIKTAMAMSQRAVAIAPGDGDARHFAAILLALAGQFEAALAEQRIAAPLNPLYPPLLEGIGHRLRYLWRFEEAAEIYEQSLRNGFERVYENLFWVYNELGRIEDAAHATIQTNEQPELDEWDRMMLAYYGGDREEATRLYEAHFLADRPPSSEGRLRAFMDAGYAGDFDYAFEALMASAELKRVNLIRMLRSKLAVDVYSDPRWVKFWNHPNMKPLFDLYLEAGDAPWIPIMNAAIAEREANPKDG